MTSRTNLRTHRIAGKLLISLWIFIMVFSSLHTGAAKTADSLSTHQLLSFQIQQSLPEGSWWTISRTYKWMATGSGSDSGKWTLDGKSDRKFTVTKHDAENIIISYSSSSSWSSTATETWVKPNGGATKKGESTATVTYTLDASTLVVKAVSDKDYQDEVGHPVWFLVNPTELRPGATISLPWTTASATIVDVPWSVTKAQTVNVKGGSAACWTLEHTGESMGYWRVGETRSSGTETDTYLFDTTHGVYLGESISGSYSFDRSGGGWSETHSATSQVVNTNLVFSVLATIGAEPTGVVVVVDGVTYAGDQLPKVFTWDIGSTHTVEVNATIQDKPGVRYVFAQWNDGSTDKSITVTAMQPVNCTATFKIQYELKVDSDLGKPEGDGWYDSGSRATFSVISPQPEAGVFGVLGAKQVFQDWTGDSLKDTATATIVMNGPKSVKAEWKADYTLAFIVLGAVVGGVAVAGGFGLVRARRKPAESTVLYDVPSPPPVAPATRRKAPAARPPTDKFCMNCGAPLSARERFCNKCGAKLGALQTPVPMTVKTTSSSTPFAGKQFIIDQKIMAMRDTYGIKDRNGNLLAYVKKKVVSLGPNFWFESPDGARLGEVKGKVVTVRPTFEVYDAQGQLVAVVKKKVLKLLGSEWWLENASGQEVARIKGKIMAHDFTIQSPTGTPLAQITKKWVTLRDSYGVEIVGSGLDPYVILAYAVVMDHVQH